MARTERPVLTGLVALVAVGILVGLFMGGAALAATRVLGLGGGNDSTNTSDAESLYLPRPSRTHQPSGPLITLAPDPSGSATSRPSSKPTKKQTPDKAISLSASQTEVGQMEQIDLTGVYPQGEGAILQVQRFQAGSWVDFPVTASVSNETFSTYVQTSQLGINRFRVVDTDTGLESNDVRVRVG